MAVRRVVVASTRLRLLLCLLLLSGLVACENHLNMPEGDLPFAVKCSDEGCFEDPATKCNFPNGNCNVGVGTCNVGTSGCAPMYGYGYYPGYWGNGAAQDPNWMSRQVMGDPALGRKKGGIGISNCNTCSPAYPVGTPQAMIPQVMAPQMMAPPANGQMWPMNPRMGAAPQVPMNPNPISGYVTVPSQGMNAVDGISYPPRPVKIKGAQARTGMPCPPVTMAQPKPISQGTLKHMARESRFPSEVIKAGDVVDVRFRYWPELDYAQTVRPDGRITLQLVNDVHVAGMTPSKASVYLEELYEDKLKEPEISLYVRYTADQRVYVGGEVRNPGLYRVEGKKTALQAVMEAGGFINQSADQTKVVVLRDHCGTRYGVIKNLKEILRNSPNKPLYIKGDDVVFVTRLRIDEINQNINQYINNMMPRVPFQWVRADGDITWGWPGGF